MTSTHTTPLTLAHIRTAHLRIAHYIHRTPVLTSQTLDQLAGAKLYFKCENFQKIGAFKARGAHNAVFSLTEKEATRGVATHSSGNHAAALALAARNRGVPAYIVMPSNSPASKVDSVRRLGGQISFCEPTLLARETAANKVVADTGATLIHPYDDLRVMAGQGTAALELMETESYLDAVVCPVGGGGLLSGTAVASKGMNPTIRVYAAEPAGADDASRSFRQRKRIDMITPNTIADGLRTSLGRKPFDEILRHVDDIVTVSDEEIIAAMKQVWSILKIVIEPSAAVPVAAVLQRRLPYIAGKDVGVILSGGNLDLDRLPWTVRNEC